MSVGDPAAIWQLQFGPASIGLCSGNRQYGFKLFLLSFLTFSNACWLALQNYFINSSQTAIITIVKEEEGSIYVDTGLVCHAIKEDEGGIYVDTGLVCHVIKEEEGSIYVETGLVCHVIKEEGAVFMWTLVWHVTQ